MPTDVAGDLARLVERDGGVVLGTYRQPFGGKSVMLVSLPIDRVEPTPFQGDASEPHVTRLMTVIATLGGSPDPIIAVRDDDRYWTPNGNHRLQPHAPAWAPRRIVALLIREGNVAFQILAPQRGGITRRFMQRDVLICVRRASVVPSNTSI